MKFMNNNIMLIAIHYASYYIMRKDSVYRWTTTDNPVHNTLTKNKSVVIGRRCDGKENNYENRN